MHEINISVSNRIPVCRTADAYIVADNSGYVLNFTFDDEWDEYPLKTLRINYPDWTYDEKVFSGSSVTIDPVSVVCGGEFEIGIYAGSIRTTQPLRLTVVPSVLSKGIAPNKNATAAPDVYAMIDGKLDRFFPTEQTGKPLVVGENGEVGAGEWKGGSGATVIPGDVQVDDELVGSIIDRAKELELLDDCGTAFAENAVICRELDSTEPIGEKRVLIFEDDFDTETLNTDIWRCQLGDLRKSTEKQYYTDRPENVYTQDGCLVLRAVRESLDQNSPTTWSSGAVESVGKFEFQRGYVEAKIKLPNVYGAFPAFWMLGHGNVKRYLYDGTHHLMLGELSPDCGEIDIIEQMPALSSFNSNVISTVHYGVNGVLKSRSVGASEPFDSSQWHIYALRWTEDQLTTYLDGNVIGTYAFETTSGDSFRRPYYLILNLAVGAGGGTPSTSLNEMKMYVDYVRVYSLENEGYIMPKVMLTLDHSSLTLDVDGEAQLRSFVCPKEVYERTVTWETSDESVAQVYGGHVRAVGTGVCEIKATTKEGLKATCKVTVGGEN